MLPPFLVDSNSSKFCYNSFVSYRIMGELSDGDIQKARLKNYTLQSLELGEEMQLLVYLPANFSPLYKYSLLIAQDGRDYFQLGRIGRLADEFLFKEKLKI